MYTVHFSKKKKNNQNRINVIVDANAFVEHPKSYLESVVSSVDLIMGLQTRNINNNLPDNSIRRSRRFLFETRFWIPTKITMYCNRIAKRRTETTIRGINFRSKRNNYLDNNNVTVGEPRGRPVSG